MRGRVGVLAVVILGGSLHHLLRVEKVLMRGVVVAIEARAVVEGPLPVELRPHGIEPMQLASQALPAGFRACPYRAVGEGVVCRLRAVGTGAHEAQGEAVGSRMVLCGSEQQLQGVGAEPVVGIEHECPFAFEQRHGTVARLCLSFVLGCGDDHEAVVGSSISVENGA